MRTMNERTGSVTSLHFEAEELFILRLITISLSINSGLLSKSEAQYNFTKRTMDTLSSFEVFRPCSDESCRN